MPATETKSAQTTDQATATASPDKATPPTKRSLTALIGKRNPDNDAILAEIQDQPVMVASATMEQRQGKRRKYWVTTVTLDDDRSFTVVGGGVAKPLGYLEPEDFPVECTFYLEPSEFSEGEYYWAVK